MSSLPPSLPPTHDEPPYLTVGTDVSAKYRGAFCEAKIKTAKRLVKAKVTFKPDLTTVEVHDDSIQGPLKVGAVVEVKNPDGVYQEASINKLTDCSIYTVVFDDGDEKTLRRSSLCLKGARHFAESETLDRLPLTNPEHFGTPVIGKKGNRGRRSNPALEFVHQAAVPSSWRTEVKDESSSSEEDDDDDEEEQEEDASDEEEEVEPFPEERENFLQQLYKFMEDRGTPINKKPVLGYRNLDLFKLYRLVQKRGGFHDIESGSVWKTVYQALGIPVLNSAAGYNVKCAYRKYLYGFEEYCTSCVITFRMDLPLKQPKAEGESGEAWSGGATSVPPVASSSCGEEQKQNVSEKSSASSETSSAQPDIYKVSVSLSLSVSNQFKGCFFWNGKLLSDAAEAEMCFIGFRDESCSREGDGGDEDLGEEGEEFECYPPGMKVQVRYGRGRSLKTYQATVKDADVEGGEVLYLVHYCGWNVRYDEWVKADKIVRPANKNVQKIKHRKKIKNKAERERNRLERLNQDLGSPSPNNLRVPRPSSKLLGPGYGSCPGLAHELHVFSKMEDGENQRTMQSFEITSILNGLSSSDDEGGAPPPTDTKQSETDREREQPSSCPKSKPSPSKKYNGMKDKTDKRGGSGNGARPAGFWDIPEKRAKMAATVDERERQVGGGRTKGQKDVWSSIQAQWPKKTLKELFSDSDTEAANSPPPPGTAQSFSSGLEERESKGERNGDGDEAGGGPEREDPGTSEENQEKEEQEEFPPSGSNSVLNTPPTTPESPSMEGISSGAIAQSSGTGSNWTQPSSPPLSTGTPALCKTPSSDPLTPGYPNPLTLRLTPGHPNPLTPGHPNPLTLGSDSEDQLVGESMAKSSASKTHGAADMKGSISSKCLSQGQVEGHTPPSSQKYHKEQQHGYPDHRAHHGRTASVYKWSVQMSDLEKMCSLERISFLQEKLQDIRNHYLSLKSEVASIDRRRKRIKKKESESESS
uniref:ARID domain-containing protein n=1 Tax=Oncorhynchus tshawytscha TaxID=74940 RepID=A0AAZ3RC79_ONCTS